MIVRWSLVELPGVLAEVGIERPFLISSPRWQGLELPAAAGRLLEVPSERVEVPAEADGILAVGGGSAIDTGKYASAQSGKPVVHVPTTYSGAEWTTFYGIRSPDRIIRGSGGGAQPVAIVYDVDLTLGLPADVTAGTALNGLAHCAEALYVRGRTPEGDERALAGARLIAAALPQVLADPIDRDARLELLRGAAHAGHALGLAGLGLAHAMAQALGGTYGIPHGAMNALCLPPALEFNRAVVPQEVARFGEAVGGDAVERTRELALLGGFDRLSDFGVPEEDLPAVAEAAAQRGGNQANPRPATPAEILELLTRIW
ncbi:MAG TPA: iron-containing alcohol dehydrogenase [Gaiellaceae bacterium]|nr:iron-containing alcohol dehydrogenase [Gaiellaceae bacterium]